MLVARTLPGQWPPMFLVCTSILILRAMHCYAIIAHRSYSNHIYYLYSLTSSQELFSCACVTTGCVQFSTPEILHCWWQPAPTHWISSFTSAFLVSCLRGKIVPMLLHPSNASVLVSLVHSPHHLKWLYWEGD